jgi:hypothetical protein
MTPDKPQKTNGVNLLIAALVIASVLGMVALMLRAGDQLAGAYGPAKIARAPDGTVWAVSYGKVHHFRQDGTRLEAIDLTAFGVANVLSEIVALSDGSLLLAEADPSMLLRCTTAPPKCASLSDAIAASGGATNHALMVSVNEAAGRMAISDNAGHRVLLADLQGKVLDQTAARRLIYPNELTLDNDAVTIADTNHHRIVKIALANDHFGADQFSFSVITPELALAGRTWPMDVVRAANGDWWVLDEANGMKNGYLVAYAANGTPKARIDLGEVEDPTQILLLDKFALVASPVEGYLNKLDFDGRPLGPFGDAAFNADLDAGRSIKTRWSAIRLAAQIGVGALPLLGILILYLRGERPVSGGGRSLVKGVVKFDYDSIQAGGPPAPLASGFITWIAFNDDGLEQLRRKQRALGILLPVLIAGAIYLCRPLWHAPKPVLGLLVFALLPLILIMVILVVLLLRGPRFPRLGTDGKFIYFEPPGKEQVRVAIDDALMTNSALMLGKRMIQLRLPVTAIYDDGELKRVLLSRLPREAWTNPARFFWIGLCRGMWFAWANVLLLALAVPMVVYRANVVSFMNYAMQGIVSKLMQ